SRVVIFCDMGCSFGSVSLLVCGKSSQMSIVFFGEDQTVKNFDGPLHAAPVGVWGGSVRPHRVGVGVEDFADHLLSESYCSVVPVHLGCSSSSCSTGITYAWCADKQSPCFGAALARPGCRPVGGGEVANSPRCSSLCEALGEESGVLPFGEKILALPQGDGDALVPADVVIGISAVPEILCRQG